MKLFTAPLAAIRAALRRHTLTVLDRGRHLTPEQVTAIANATAYVAEHPTRCGTMISIYCPECGQGSPTFEANRAASMALEDGWAIAATCQRCDSVIMSRKLSEPMINHFHRLGILDGELAVSTFREQIADL